MRILFLIGACLLKLHAYAWDDHPDIPDFSQQDRIYRDAQEYTGAGHYEKSAPRDPWNLETGEDRRACEDRNHEIGTITPPERDR